MKIAFGFVFILFLAAPARAQQPAAATGAVTAVRPSAKQALKRKAAPEPKEDKKTVPAPAQTQNKEAAKGEQASFAPGASKGQGPAKLLRSGADQPEEEGAVMIDAGNDEDYSGRFSDNEPAAAAEPEAAAGPGMPASYGQLKGTLTDGGRSLLVFENEDGAIAFVQIVAGKNAVTWKFVSRIYRSAD